MKKQVSLSLFTALLITSSVSAWTFGNSQNSTVSIHPVPIDLRAIENGGPLFAIEAASDGVGALIVDPGVAGSLNVIDNSSFNNSVYIFGQDAMDNNVLLNDQINFGLNPVTDSQRNASNDIAWNITTNKVDAVFRCDDGDPTTFDDQVIGGLCSGFVEGDACKDDNNPDTTDIYSGGACKHLFADGVKCDDNDPNTYNDIYTTQSCSGVPPSANLVCDDNDLDTINDKFNRKDVNSPFICHGRYEQVIETKIFNVQDDRWGDSVSPKTIGFNVVVEQPLGFNFTSCLSYFEYTYPKWTDTDATKYYVNYYSLLFKTGSETYMICDFFNNTEKFMNQTDYILKNDKLYKTKYISYQLANGFFFNQTTRTSSNFMLEEQNSYDENGRVLINNKKYIDNLDYSRLTLKKSTSSSFTYFNYNYNSYGINKIYTIAKEYFQSGYIYSSGFVSGSNNKYYSLENNKECFQNDYLYQYYSNYGKVIYNPNCEKSSYKRYLTSARTKLISESYQYSASSFTQSAIEYWSTNSNMKSKQLLNSIGGYTFYEIYNEDGSLNHKYF